MNTKELAPNLIRVTENAAIAASHYIGRGDKKAADAAATEAMRTRLNTIDFAGTIVISEGVKDDAPMLIFGEKVGSRLQIDGLYEFDIGCDPIEGTTPTANGGYEAMSVIVAGTKGSLFSSDCFYMRKLAFGSRIAKYVSNISVKDPIEKIISRISQSIDKPINSITVCVLDRPRHKKDIETLRELGCRIKLISDCDVSGVIATCTDSGVDVFYSAGGTTEGVIASAAVKCMRGFFQGMLVDKEGKVLDEKIYNIDDLTKGDVVFCATGITLGMLLKGVRFIDGKAHTHSILMRSDSGTVRFVEAIHGN